MPQVPISGIDDPRLAVYRDLPRQNLTRHSRRMIAEGDKLVDRLIASRYPVESILAEEEPARRYAALVDADVPIYVVTRSLLEAVIGFNFHRGVLACGRRDDRTGIEELLESLRGLPQGADAPRSPIHAPRSPIHAPRSPVTIVVCPDVQDPTNLGSIIRSAAAFGCAAVVLGDRCADPFSRRVLRVSMGAALHLPIVESTHLMADLQCLADRGFELAATVVDPAAEPLATAKRGPRLALVFGSEGHGLSPEIQSLCGQRVTIPMQLGIDSLNVAVAAAVVLYHFTR